MGWESALFLWKIAFSSKKGKGRFDFVVRAFGSGDAFVEAEFVGCEGLPESGVFCSVVYVDGLFAASQGDVRGVGASFAGESTGFHGLKDLLGEVEETRGWLDLGVKYA